MSLSEPVITSKEFESHGIELKSLMEMNNEKNVVSMQMQTESKSERIP